MKPPSATRGEVKRLIFNSETRNEKVSLAELQTDFLIEFGLLAGLGR